ATVDQRSGIPKLGFSDNGWQSNDDFVFDRFVIAPTQVDDSERSAQINVRFDGEHSSLKMGVLGRWRERGVNVDENELRRGPAIDLSDWTTAAPEHRGGTLDTNVLPGLHLRYDSGNDWVLRFAANKTLSRPAFGDVSPRVSINRGDNEVSLGNPDLDPYRSQNLDLSFEKYLGSTGVISLGVFHKSIDDYIVQTINTNDAEFPGLQVTRSINGDTAKVRGAEFNWQQTLDFLPEGWNGFLVGASATVLDSDFNPGLENRAGDDFTLPRSSKRIYSGHLGYEKYGFSARVAAV
ncbi:hypothetical protein DB807_22075, partial [Xanthomonas perforans]|uniref:TonB-dependent receptor domain-containing protein n=1 Tax=Xanthomonas perforans TaxID=442694 RepID=UPI00115F13F8